MRVLAAIIAGWFLLAAPPQTPARDVPRAATVGTASISGAVLADDDTHAPVRRVTLSLARAEFADTRVTATDDRGRYLFTDLPAGIYTLSASKGGYVSANYGAAKPGQLGNPIPLAAAQRFAALPIAITRGAVITGRLTNAQNRPIAHAQVEAAQFQVVNGERRRRPGAGFSRSAGTDSRGVYRIYGLAPGDYVVSSNSQLATGEMREPTAAELVWAEQQSRVAAGTGASPAGAVTAAAAPLAGGAFIFAPSFYPGTADPSAAAVVTVGRGEERQGVDFQLIAVTTARVSGIVTGLDGRPAPNVPVTRTTRQGYPFSPLISFGGYAQTAADGTFSIASTAPGEYVLAARAAAAGDTSSTPRHLLWAMTEIVAAGNDITGLSLRLQPGMTVSGKIVFDGSTLQRPSNASQLQVRLVSTAANLQRVDAFPATVNQDGTFTIDDLLPGPYRLVATAPVAPGASSGWIQSSALHNGRNILDLPFEIHPNENLSDVVVTFSDRQTELSGRIVEHATGRPAPQFFVLLFPVDKTYWTANSRWIKTARAGVDGTFKISGLPAGEYYVCALTEVDAALQFEPSYLEPLIGSSVKMTFADGDKRAQELRIGG